MYIYSNAPVNFVILHSAYCRCIHSLAVASASMRSNECSSFPHEVKVDLPRELIACCHSHTVPQAFDSQERPPFIITLITVMIDHTIYSTSFYNWSGLTFTLVKPITSTWTPTKGFDCGRINHNLINLATIKF